MALAERLSFSEKTNRRFFLLLLVFIILSVATNLILPVMEGPDEPEHYGYVEALRRSIGPDELARQERAQPPLYYLTATALVKPLALEPWNGELILNEWWAFDAPVNTPDNDNHFLHTPAESSFATGVRVARIASLLYGILTVTCTWLAAKELFTSSTGAFLAAAYVAFTPQFIQITAQVSNDSAAAGLSALALWRLIVVARHGLTNKNALLAGIALGLTALTKSNALVVLPVALLAMWIGRRQARWSWLLLPAATALIGGWWYLRGWILFNDPFGTAPHSEMGWALNRIPQMSTNLGQLPLTLSGYWVDFGWGEIRPGLWYFAGVAALLLLVIWGWLRHARHRTSQAAASLWLIPAAHFALGFAALLYWTHNFNLVGGRLLFPAHAAMGLLIAAGLMRLRPMVRWLAAGAYMTAAPVLIVTVMFPAFHMTTLNAPVTPARDPIQYGDVARLTFYNISSDTLIPNHPVEVTLCWEALASTQMNLAFAFHVFDADMNIYAARDSHHGMGRYPSSAWRPGTHFCDTFTIPVVADIPTAQILDVEVVLYDPATGSTLEATSAAGDPLNSNTIGQIRTPALLEPPPDIALLESPFVLNDAIALAGIQPTPRDDGTLDVRMVWHALAPVTETYTVFIHVLEAQTGELLAQGDRPPHYATWAWRTGEWIDETITVSLPEEGVPIRVLVGLYRPGDWVRPVVTQNGERIIDDAILVFQR